MTNLENSVVIRQS